jgi:sulfur-oxidizing protein SoxX
MTRGAALLLALALTGFPTGAPAEGMARPAMDRPLTDAPGNPGRGRLIVRDTARATCLICHSLPIPEEPDHGRIGPSLAGVGSRLTPAELRLRLVDPKAVNPDTIMPSYFRTEGLHRVAEGYRGQTIYTAQQIEDVVAYLSGLTAP